MNGKATGDIRRSGGKKIGSEKSNVIFGLRFSEPAACGLSGMIDRAVAFAADGEEQEHDLLSHI